VTSERKKAIIVITATLIVGVLIGVLGTGILARYHYRGNRNYSDKQHRESRDGFAERIYRISQADSLQLRQMQPIVNQALKSIDMLQQKTDNEVKELLDSMIFNLKPILKADQLSRLEVLSKNKSEYSGHRRKHR
jgi:hypothetical protein